MPSSPLRPKGSPAGSLDGEVHEGGDEPVLAPSLVSGSKWGSQDNLLTDVSELK